MLFYEGCPEDLSFFHINHSFLIVMGLVRLSFVCRTIPLQPKDRRNGVQFHLGQGAVFRLRSGDLRRSLLPQGFKIRRCGFREGLPLG